MSLKIPPHKTKLFRRNLRSISDIIKLNYPHKQDKNDASYQILTTKYNVLINPFQPSPTHSIPNQSIWLKVQMKWLVSRWSETLGWNWFKKTLHAKRWPTGSSRPEVLFRVVALKNFSKVLGKDLQWSLFTSIVEGICYKKN